VGVVGFWRRTLACVPHVCAAAHAVLRIPALLYLCGAAAARLPGASSCDLSETYLGDLVERIVARVCTCSPALTPPSQQNTLLPPLLVHIVAVSSSPHLGVL